MRNFLGNINMTSNKLKKNSLTKILFLTSIKEIMDCKTNFLLRKWMISLLKIYCTRGQIFFLWIRTTSFKVNIWIQF